MNSVKDYIARNIPLLNFLNWLFFLGLSITTLYTANSTALAKLEPVLGQYRYAAPAVALLIGFAVLAMFDMDLRKNFITALQVFTADDWGSAKRSLKVISFFILFIAGIRLALSTGATFISGTFMADALVEDGDTAGLEKMLQDKEETKQTLALELSRQATETRAAAERRAEELVSSAVTSGPAAWQRLYKQRNGWFLKQGGEISAYLQRIRNAEKEAQRIRNAAEKQAATLATTQAKAIDAEQHDAAFGAVVRAKTAQIEKAEQREYLIQFSIWMLDGLFSIMALLTSIGLVIGLQCRPDYELFREETPFSAIASEAALSVWRIVKSYGVAVVAWLDGKADSVVDSIGATVDINGRTVAMQRRNVSRNKSATAATAGATAAASAGNPTAQQAAKPVSNGVADDYYIVADQYKKATATLRAYKSKIDRGEGNPETLRRGVARWEKTVAELELQLQNMKA